MIVITNVGEIQIGPFFIGMILKSRNCAIFLLKLSVCAVSYVFSNYVMVIMNVGEIQTGPFLIGK